ncbi:MAG: hypothetical protein IJ899_03075 [Blautia sp.]|nr:hypothetical protein [Blautia sp.]
MSFSLAQFVTILVVYVIFVGSYILTLNSNNSNELYIWLMIMITVILPIWSTFLTIRFFLEKGWM